MYEAHDNAPSWSRLWPVPTAVLTVAIATFVLYNVGPPRLATLVFYPYALSLTFGPSIIYPRLRCIGVSTAQAFLASLCVPVLWLIKESYAFSAVFNFWETVYYAFNPLSLGLFTCAVLQVAIAEILLRRAWRGRWEIVSGPGFVVAGILALGGSFAVLARGNDGTIAYYTYVDLYRFLFGN